MIGDDNRVLEDDGSGLLLCQPDTDVTDSGDGILAHDMVYGNVQRVVAVQVERCDGAAYLGGADTVLSFQHPFFIDDFTIDGIMEDHLLLLSMPVTGYLAFHEQAYAAVGIGLRSTYAEIQLIGSFPLSRDIECECVAACPALDRNALVVIVGTRIAARGSTCDSRRKCCQI